MLWSQSLPSTSDSFKELLLELAQERSLDDLLPLVTRRLAEHEDVALARLWLLEQGRSLRRVRERAGLRRSRRRCLHLVASAARDRDSGGVTAHAAQRRLPAHPRRRVQGRRGGGVARAGGRHRRRARRRRSGGPTGCAPKASRRSPACRCSSRGELLGVLGVFVRAPITPAARRRAAHRRQPRRRRDRDRARVRAGRGHAPRAADREPASAASAPTPTRSTI